MRNSTVPFASQSRSSGKERDSETGLDYFGARYYGSTMGRFTSADKPFVDQHVHDPQSWNLYSYTRNNPLRYIDDDGEEVKETVRTVTYTVHGQSVGEALNNSKQISGFKSESGEPMSGNTQASMRITNVKMPTSVQPGNGIADSFATAEITSADVELKQTITLPTWAERDSATPDEQMIWDIKSNALEDHERGHAAINRQEAEKLDKSLPGTRGSGRATNPDDAARRAQKNATSNAQQKLSNTLNTTRQKNRKYDEDTDHGRKTQ